MIDLGLMSPQLRYCRWVKRMCFSVDRRKLFTHFILDRQSGPCYYLGALFSLALVTPAEGSSIHMKASQFLIMTEVSLFSSVMRERADLALFEKKMNILSAKARHWSLYTLSLWKSVKKYWQLCSRFNHQTLNSQWPLSPWVPGP